MCAGGRGFTDPTAPPVVSKEETGREARLRSCRWKAARGRRRFTAGHQPRSSEHLGDAAGEVCPGRSPLPPAGLTRSYNCIALCPRLKPEPHQSLGGVYPVSHGIKCHLCSGD